MMATRWQDRLILPCAGRTRQVSSFRGDLRGGNWGGLRPEAARRKRILLEPGESHTMAELSGPGVITRIWMTVAPAPPFPALRDVVLRCYWDGEEEPSVLCGLGDFFGAGFGRMRPYVSAPFSCASGGLTCSLPMPFATGAVLRLTNEGRSVADPVFYAVTYDELEEPHPGDLRLHARWNRENPTPAGTPYTILRTSGRGHYVGARLDMQNRQRWVGLAPSRAVFPFGLGFGMLEGPERIFVDGEVLPSISGTGTEDYFNAGWYFASGTFCAPTYGCTVHSWPMGRVSAYRYDVAAPVPFSSSILVTVDHGMDNVVAADYASVAYWYQAEPHPPYPPLPSPQDRRPAFPRSNVAQSLVILAPAAASVLGVGRMLAQRRRG